MPLRHPRFWEVLGWLLVLIVAWASLTPTPPKLPAVLAWDKAQHFLAYGVLSFWFCNISKRAFMWALLFVAMGICLEYLQGMGGIRVMETMDMVANTLGVAFGWFLATISGGLVLVHLETTVHALIDRKSIRN